jgi:UDP-glucose 4-epimerase
MTILVTGGAGYIGSHAVLSILRSQPNTRVVVVDNLFRGHTQAIDALHRTAGPGRLTFIAGDVGDRELMLRTLIEHRVTTIMHFAALAYVGESVTQPLRYYRNSSAATLGMLEAVHSAWTLNLPGYAGVNRLIFSSTCASYGEPAPDQIPIRETCPQNPVNPYGRGKLHCEHILRDFAEQARREGRDYSWAALRYFNVAGSDPEGLIGEHHEPETHLIPVCLQAVLGQRDALTIHGTDYPTPDGTCIRDYVHVVDLVEAHLATLAALKVGEHRVYNLGIGQGMSVRQIIESVKRVTGVNFKVHEGPRRAGDPPELYADPAKIKAELGWHATFTRIDDIVSTAWHWFKAHPRGYHT